MWDFSIASHSPQRARMFGLAPGFVLKLCLSMQPTVNGVRVAKSKSKLYAKWVSRVGATSFRVSEEGWYGMPREEETAAGALRGLVCAFLLVVGA